MPDTGCLSCGDHKPGLSGRAIAHIQIDEIGARSVLVPQKQRGRSFTDYTLNRESCCVYLRNGDACTIHPALHLEGPTPCTIAHDGHRVS